MISRAERAWLIGAVDVAFALCAVPYIVAATFGPPDLERGGTFWFVSDFSQYQAAMREAGWSSSWLVHDRFTAEPHTPALMYTLYVAIGKLAAVTGADAVALFGALEWFSRAALVAALYAFAATFLRLPSQRRLAVLLAGSTLGLGALAVPARSVLMSLGAAPLAERLPTTITLFLEISSFGMFLTAPHLQLGLTCTLLCAPVYLRARAGQRGWLLALAALVALLSLVHPFNLPVLATVLIADALIGSRGQAAGLRVAAVVLASAAPLAAYNALLFRFDLFWSATYGGSQNLMPSPLPWIVPVDFGLVLLVAPAAWPALRTWPADRRRLLLLWLGLGFMFLYVPVPYQRRFGMGLQPALAVLAAVGLSTVSAWMRTHRWGTMRRRLANYALAIVAAATSTLVYASVIASAATNSPAEIYPWSRAEADAGRWLAWHSGGRDVVLASTAFANPLVGIIDGRVVHGHIVATKDSPVKEALVERFYAADITVAERSELLRRSTATVVAFGPHERALGATSLAGQPELYPIYDERGVAWYRVRRDAEVAS